MKETFEEAANKANGYNVYAKETKAPIFNEGFIAGAKWQQEQDNTANEILEYILLNDDGVGIALGYNSREMIEHYFKRIGYPVTEVENNNRV